MRKAAKQLCCAQARVKKLERSVIYRGFKRKDGWSSSTSDCQLSSLKRMVEERKNTIDRQKSGIKSLKRGLDDLTRSVDEVNAKKPRFFRGFCVEAYTKGWPLNPLGKRGDKSRHLKLRPHRPLSVRLWRQPVQAQTWTLPCHYPNHKKE